MAIKSKKSKPTTIEFDFIKSNYFRSVRADGIFGGLAPNGTIHMAVFTERSAIPKKIIHSIDNGTVGSELTEQREGRQAIVREVEFDIVFDYQMALVVREWLDQKIREYATLVEPILKSKQN